MSRLKDFPFSPRQFPIFYGWILVAVGTLGVLSSIPGQTMGVSVFMPKLTEALGLDTQQLSISYLVGTLTSGLLLVRGGRLIDRLGVRPMIVIASCSLGVSLVLLSACGVIAGFIGANASEFWRQIVAMSVVLVCFFLIRFFGQGLLAMIPRVMLGKWFEHRRGLAIGIMGVVVSFGFGGAPLFLQQLVEAFGWRGAYYFLAIVIGGGMAVVGGIFFRERPEDFGLPQDGIPEPEHDSETGPKLHVTHHFTLAEARRSYAFWIFTLGLGTHGLIITAVTFHILPLSESFGLTADEGLSIFIYMAFANVVSNLVSGYVSDRVRLKFVLMVMLLSQAVGTASLLNFGADWSRWSLIVADWIANGIWGVLVGVTWPRYFGTLHLGEISGQNMSIMVIATSVAPLLFAVPYEQTGSYAYGILAALALPIMLFIAALRVENPQELEARAPDRTGTPDH